MNSIEQMLIEEFQETDFEILLRNCIPKREWCRIQKRIPKEMRKLAGKKIHLNQLQGIYEVVKVVPNGLLLTCKVWQYSDHKERLFPFDRFKCLAGGKWNRKY